jgi:RNA polymerase sigma-70 factor (ECF subfamily)
VRQAVPQDAAVGPCRASREVLESSTMEKSDLATDDETIQILLKSHRRFLAFLVPRVGAYEDAEEILQTALAKAVQHEDSLEKETVVAWFYQVLKNSLADYYRHRGVEKRAMRTHRDLAMANQSESAELERTVCECFKELLPTLKPEYAEALKTIDLGDATVTDAAKTLGITANNAAVRLHRARLALKKSLEATCKTCAVHGCYDCTCEKC